MKAVVYRATGDPDVLELEDREVPSPGAGEVRVRIHVSGVNPTDWKTRRGAAPGQPPPFPVQVPNQDGAGVVDAVGPGCTLTVGQRVWVWEAAWKRADGTAQEMVVLPERQTVPLPDLVSFDIGASLGIPALTAHRTLTVSPGAPSRLYPGSLDGRIVLVAGGAGAVGHAAIQLARWAGATVITSVSSQAQAELARLAGAHQVVNYRTQDPPGQIRRAAPDGVDTVVEVAPAVNVGLNAAVLAPNGTVAVYANNGGDEAALPVRASMTANIRYQFVLVYTVPAQAKSHAIEDVSAAVLAGAMPVGAESGLPLTRFTLEQTASAHEAVEANLVGKVLIDIG